VIEENNVNDAREDMSDTLNKICTRARMIRERKTKKKKRVRATRKMHRSRPPGSL
jgi:peptidoglycan hydrolase CwlO-like protein